MWPDVLASLDGPVMFSKKGSLVVAHPSDEQELTRLQRKVAGKSPDPSLMETVDERRIAELEPALAGRFRTGLYFPEEGHLDNREVLKAMARTLHALGVEWRTASEVDRVRPHEIRSGNETFAFDWVVDTRGLGAQEDLPDLRGVRGELVYVHAPEVELGRPVRFMHPRYPIYLVPRAGQVFVIGATAIESDDMKPITVRSTLELLSAAYAVHTGFAEATLLETVVNCRPAFPDNRPRIEHADGIVRINGLYRHGFLLSPIIVEAVADFLATGNVNGRANDLFREVQPASG
jgi:glycine oxidase